MAEVRIERLRLRTSGVSRAQAEALGRAVAQELARLAHRMPARTVGHLKVALDHDSLRSPGKIAAAIKRGLE